MLLYEDVMNGPIEFKLKFVVNAIKEINKDI